MPLKTNKTADHVAGIGFALSGTTGGLRHVGQWNGGQ
jgi:hypothetical protein